MPRPAHTVAAAALGLFLIVDGAAAQNAALPKADLDMKNIIRAAKHIQNQSLPGCYTAPCVKVDCALAGRLMEPMLQATVVLNVMDKQLIALRDKYLKQGMANVQNAARDQDRSDNLRDLQLIQDSLATVYVAASEIASTLDFTREFKDKAAAWKNPLQPGEDRDRYFAFLKHVKDTASRVNSFSKYPGLGKDKKQKIGWQDYSKFAGEAYVRARDAEWTLKKDGLKSPKLSKAALSQLKDVLDMSLKMDRMARQLRVDQYLDQSRQALGLAQNAVEGMRRANERRRTLQDALAELHKAMTGLGACHLRQCQGQTGRPRAADVSMTGRPDKKAGVGAALRFYNKKLKGVDQRLWELAYDYNVVADYQSRLSTTKKAVSYGEPVVARYKLTKFRKGKTVFRCVPDGAELKVYRTPHAKGHEAVMNLGPVKKDAGKREFKLQQDLIGTWRAANADLQVTLAINGDAATLTRKNVPVSGRDRVYTGSLTRKFSEPGKYTILFEGPDGDTYLPAKFEIKGSLPIEEEASTLVKIPEHAEDIGRAVPPDIRAKLVSAPHKGTFRYRATVAPVISADGQLKLRIEFYNHRIEFKKKSRKIEAVVEKTWHKDTFKR